MHTIIVIGALLAISMATPLRNEVAVTQDTLGNYRLRYDTLHTDRKEVRREDGSVSGSYSYTDPAGTLHVVNYAGGANSGFNVQGSDLPTPVPESAEIIALRNAHLRATAKAQVSSPTQFSLPNF